MRPYTLLIAVLCVPFLLNIPAAEAQDSTYAPWQGQTQSGDIQQLLKQLRAMIAKAERAKAADPVFLSDLRKLADSYDNQWPTKVLYDDFKDGDFTANPAWTVDAGTWRVDTQGSNPGLQSRVPLAQANNATQGGSSTQQAVIGILGNLLNPQQGSQTQQAPQDKYAAISIPLSIPSSFAIRLEIASREPGGRFDFGAYQGAQSENGYYLSYAPATANGLTLSSVVSGTGTRQIANSNGPVRLEDGVSHVIDWKRDRMGKMTIMLDGKTVMEVTDTTIRRPFDGFLLANSGGRYTIRSVAINGGR